MHPRRSGLLLFGLLLLAPAVAARPFTVCVLEQEFVARAADEDAGSGQALVRKAVASLGDTVVFSGAPWRRCIAGVRGGQFDAVLGAAATPSFLSFMRFPMKNGAADPGAALASTAHVVLRRSGGPAGWDGQRFVQLDGPVYYPSGSAIVGAKLAQLAVAGNDSTKTAQQLMRMLQHRRIALLVLRKSEAQALLADSEFSTGIEMLAQPFVVAYAYLGVSRALQESDPAYTAALWAHVAAGVRQRAARPLR